MNYLEREKISFYLNTSEEVEGYETNIFIYHCFV